MKNMRISKKLFVSFAIVVALALLIGGTAVIGLSSLNNAATTLYNSNVIAIDAMGNLRELFNQERNDLREMFLSKDDPEAVKKLIAGFDTYKEKANEYFEAYETTIIDVSEEAAYFAAKEAYIGPYATMKTDMFNLMNNNDFDTALATFRGGVAVIQPITTGFAQGAALNIQWASDENDKTSRLFVTLTIITCGIIVAAVAISVFLGVRISSLISKPIVLLTDFMNKASSTGDIVLGSQDVAIISEYANIRDETGQCITSTAKFIQHVSNIAEKIGLVEQGDLRIDVNVLSEKDVMGIALKNMVSNLNIMFGSINNAAEQVNSGAGKQRSNASVERITVVGSGSHRTGKLD